MWCNFYFTKFWIFSNRARLESWTETRIRIQQKPRSESGFSKFGFETRFTSVYCCYFVVFVMRPILKTKDFNGVFIHCKAFITHILPRGDEAIGYWSTALVKVGTLILHQISGVKVPMPNLGVDAVGGHSGFYSLQQKWYGSPRLVYDTLFCTLTVFYRVERFFISLKFLMAFLPKVKQNSLTIK